jgi:hypothetical protein
MVGTGWQTRSLYYGSTFSEINGRRMALIISALLALREYFSLDDLSHTAADTCSIQLVSIILNYFLRYY